MADSLLAHLYTRIKGSQEDVATLSLQYIITASSELNHAFNKLLSATLGISLDPDISYSCQSVGDNKERPDMSGIDKTGKERVLCEMKFWAGLTDNQPIGYINRLKANGGQALVFVCPEERKVSLWDKVKKLCMQEYEMLENETDNKVCVNGIVMAIVTWKEIIYELQKVALSTSSNLIHDIEQLAGYCEYMDRKAFVPFKPEELGPITPLMEDRYYQVVDGVISKLNTIKELSPRIRGKQSPYKSGYVRNIVLNEYIVGVSYDRAYWASTPAEAPFWITIRDLEERQPMMLNELYDRIPEKEKTDFYGVKAIALRPLANVPLDDIVDDLVGQIIGYISILVK